MPQKDTYVMVMPADQPTIVINGTLNLAREYEAFMQGIELFSSVSIIVNQESDADEDGGNDVEDLADNDEDSNGASVAPSVSKLIGEHKLDNCNIQVYPPLNPDHEYFRLPNNMMQQLAIRHKETKNGIFIYGRLKTVMIQ